MLARAVRDIGAHLDVAKPCIYAECLTAVRCSISLLAGSHCAVDIDVGVHGRLIHTVLVNTRLGTTPAVVM